MNEIEKTLGDLVNHVHIIPGRDVLLCTIVIPNTTVRVFIYHKCEEYFMGEMYVGDISLKLVSANTRQFSEIVNTDASSLVEAATLEELVCIFIPHLRNYVSIETKRGR